MKEFASPLSQEAYVRALIAANGKLVADAERARDLAGAANDPESQDLVIGRITLHQKTIWMLKSFLKNQRLARTARRREQREIPVAIRIWGSPGCSRAARSWHQRNARRQTITEATIPTASAIRPAGTAWRVRFTPTAPK